MLTTLVIVFALIILSGFFSGSETALTAVSRPFMHQLEQNGDKRASRVNQLHAHKDRFISTILFGNNLVNILASALTTSLMIQIYGEAGVAYATLTMTVLILIFAEILPKTYALRHANPMALTLARPVSFLVWICRPFTFIIHIFIRGLLMMFGVRYENGEALTLTDDELRGAIELHEGDGDETDARQEREMLRSVLDLAEVQVGEILIHRKNVEAINVDQSPEDIVEQVLESPFTRLPLWQGTPENVIGVLHAKALLREFRSSHDDVSKLDIKSLAADPWFIPEQTLLLGQLQEFRRRREHFALVVDEYGALMGVVTLEDILEEIVGEIDDEHDVQVSGVHKQSDGRYLIDGTVTIRDLNREFDWGLPDEEASTLAGFILHHSRRIPNVGQRFRFFDFEFDIAGRERHQITQIRVFPPKS